MSQDLIILKVPESISEQHTLVRWVETSIEGTKLKVKSIKDCIPEIQALIPLIVENAPVIEVYPPDTGFEKPQQKEFEDWVILSCTNRNLLEVKYSFSNQSAFDAFVGSLVEEVGALKLYMMQEGEVIFGAPLSVDPKKSPEYRRNQANEKLIAKLPDLAPVFDAIIKAKVQLQDGLEYRFFDRKDDPNIGILCSDRDYAALCAGLDTCSGELFKALRKVTRVDVSFQPLKSSEFPA